MNINEREQNQIIQKKKKKTMNLKGSLMRREINVTIIQSD